MAPEKQLEGYLRVSIYKATQVTPPIHTGKRRGGEAEREEKKEIGGEMWVCEIVLIQIRHVAFLS